MHTGSRCPDCHCWVPSPDWHVHRFDCARQTRPGPWWWWGTDPC